MLSSLLSRYRFRYLSTLVYMLQSSEYDSREYLRWLRRTHNFDLVAKRGRLDRTPKARLLLLILIAKVTVIWIVMLGLLWLSVQTGTFLAWLALAAAVILVMPYFLAYGLLVPLWIGRILVQRPRERAIIRSAHHKLAAHPAIKIGIAGSYGKTTMKDLLATVLAEGKIVAATPGNLNTPLGISSFVRDLQGDEEILIFELGEYYPGDIRDLCRMVEPDMGVITGVNEAHLSKFRSLERTAGTIFELADYLRDDVEIGEGPLIGGTQLYVNGESEIAHTQIEKRGMAAMKQDLIAEYTRHGVGEWKISHLSTDLEGTKFNLTRGEVKIKVASGLLGLHQAGPLATVAAIGIELGLSPEQVEKGLELTKPFEHRLEPKQENDVWTIDDTYNGNPAGAKAAIDFLASLDGHKRYYVTPGLVEIGHRSSAVHEEIGRQLAESGIENVVLIETSAMEHIKHGLKMAGFKGKLSTYPDEITALLALPSLTTAGDVVLLQNDWGDQYS